MEVDQQLVFGGIPYRVTKVLGRTYGSQNQRLIDISNEKSTDAITERVFYLAECPDGTTYWIKHYVVPDLGLGEGPDYEYDRMQACGEYKIYEYSIAPVKAYACENNMILMDYCPYPRLTDITPSEKEKDIISDLAGQWIRKYDVIDYDMCPNNTLVRIDGDTIDVKLVDFEIADPKDTLTRFIGYLKKL